MDASFHTQFKPQALYKLFIREYKFIEQVCLQLMETTLQKVERKNKAIHRIEKLKAKGVEFICDIRAGIKSHAYTVYRMGQSGKRMFCVAFSPTDHTLFHFSEHFFIRYNERCNLNKTDNESLLRNFLNCNPDFKFNTRKGINNLRAFSAVLPTGIAYGMVDVEQNTYYFRTFISNTELNFNKKAQFNIPLTKKELVDVLSTKFNVKK